MKKFLVTALLAVQAILPSTGASELATRESVGKVVSLDLCTDWMLARYAKRDQILRLKPEMVITGEYNALMLRRRLQDLGVRVEILSLPETLAEVTDYVQAFLLLLNLPQTGVPHLDVPPLKQKDEARRPRLLLLGANGIGTGRNTFEDGVIREAGWENYIDTSGYVSLDLELVVSDPPDAVLWSAPGAKALANLFAEHPALKQAVPAQRWVSTDYWQWQCPGPWSWELVNLLRQHLQSYRAQAEDSRSHRSSINHSGEDKQVLRPYSTTRLNGTIH